MATFYSTNSPSSSVSIPAVGINGQTAPVSSIEVGGVGGDGNLHPISTDNSGNQNVNVISSALPTGASTSANQTNGAQKTQVVDASGNMLPAGDVAARAIKVDASATTQPVSGTVTVTQGTGTNLHVVVDSSALPAGASTSAKQPALGTAGTASSDVLTVQGIASMTALKVDGSAVTQPVSVSSLPLPAGGSTSALQTSTQGSVSAGTAATSSTLIGGVFNTSLPTLTTGQQAGVQLDSSGRQIIAPLANTSVVKAQLQDNAGTAIVLGQTTMTASVPVTLASNQSALATTVSSGTLTTVSTVTTVGSVTSSQSAIPGIISDVASAALTTTTTTAAITPTFGSSYLVDIPVTVVSGTTPTLVVQVQESADSGTNWFTVYTFPTITAVGSYTSPVLTLQGNRVRYAQTVTGTTPSFTRAINRLQSSQATIQSPGGTTYIDRSGTTSGTINTSTTVASANQARRYFIIQNLSASASIYINFTSAASAAAGSLLISPLGSYVMESGTISTEQINVVSATASVPFTAKEG